VSDPQVAGVPQAVAPGVTRLLAPNPSPFTATGTQVHLVGTDRLVVIDPGPDVPGHLDALLAAIEGRPVEAILITHTHRDHSPMSRPLAAATGAPIVGCAPVGLDWLGEWADSFDTEYAPDQVLADGDSISVEGRTLTALATPGHASNHLCFADEAAGVLFSGDHVMGWSTSVVLPPDGDMGDYVRSLKKLQGRSEGVYFPAHGDPVTEPQRLVRGMIGHRMQREKQVLRLVGEGRSTIHAIVDAGYPGLDPRLHGAARASVWAHLVELEKRSAVGHVGDRWTSL
jgi:glyoxylase-like metal-dependent hydrolase (beta-lactamase superfamily II)